MKPNKLKFPLIILCGGKSERMGTLKGLYPINGKTWLEIQLEKFMNLGGSKVLIVLGYEYGKYFSKLIFLEKALNNVINYEKLQLQVCINEMPECGPFSSLKTAIINNQFESKAFFVCPVDVPLASLEVFEAISSEFSDNKKIIIPSFQNSGGHPILISSNWMTELKNLDHTKEVVRLDYQIKNLNENEKSYIEVNDKTVILNINEKNDWKKIS